MELYSPIRRLIALQGTLDLSYSALETRFRNSCNYAVQIRRAAYLSSAIRLFKISLCGLRRNLLRVRMDNEISYAATKQSLVHVLKSMRERMK